MCTGSKRNTSLTVGSSTMELGFQKQGGSGSASSPNFSVLLELAAADDLIGFKRAIEEEGRDVDEVSLWYGRRIGLGCNRMGFEERTPLMVAAMFGSRAVLDYILETGFVDVNRRSGTDGASALHCAVAGASMNCLEVVKLLIDCSADVDSLDARGNRAVKLIGAVHVSPPYNKKNKSLEAILNGRGGGNFVEEEEVFLLPDHLCGHELEPEPNSTIRAAEKKEYPVDLSLPDINNGIFGTDEFRMYTFKVKPCSRAYSHDWTECPFVHPGENARRRDPRKYHYSCVPCPEFRKGSCRQGDCCDYAHGIFECWLHPAQYRTRLCKDEAGCSRKVCFFAHRPQELRPLYASTGSALPSSSPTPTPRAFSTSTSSLNMASMNPLGLRSPSASASASGPTSPMWQNQNGVVPPALQLPGSKLKTSLSSRDMDLDIELINLETNRRWKQQLMEELSCLSSPSGWNNSPPISSGDRTGEFHRLGVGGVKPANLDDIFCSLSQSPTGIRQQQQLRSSFTVKLPSSPVRVDLAATNLLSSRAAAFAKRSQSFIERSAVNQHPGLSPSAVMASSPNPNEWGYSDSQLDWRIQGEELNKLRKSSSFRFHSESRLPVAASVIPAKDEPDLTWVQSLVKEDQQIHLSSGGAEKLPTWVEQLYMEPEQSVA